MSDSYTREDLDEEVNKVMEDNTEQDLSTVNDSELTTDTEADNNKGKRKKRLRIRKILSQRKRRSLSLRNVRILINRRQRKRLPEKL